MRAEINRYEQTSQIGKDKDSEGVREKLILKYAPYVKYIAERMAVRLPPHILKEELISSGIVGLIDALNNFDSSKGIKFRTYAAYRIKGAIIDELRRLDWVPKTVRKDVQRIEDAMMAVQIRTGRAPEDHEVAEEMGIDIHTYYALISKAQGGNLLSLDSMIRDESQPVLARMISDEPSPLDEVKKGELKKMVAKALSSLTDKEQLVISLYYYEELTLKEIAKVLGLTESRISQIHSKSLIRLRVKLKSYYE